MHINTEWLGTVPVSMLCALLFVVWRKSAKSQKSEQLLPPGPAGHPIFGQALEKWSNEEYLSEIGKKFGDVFSLRLFWKRVVILNSYEAIKEAFNYDWLTGRLSSSQEKELSEGGHGLVFSDGPLWRIHRRFTLSVLRDFGFGKNSMEHCIQNELNFMLEHISKHDGQPFSPHQVYAKAVSNVLNWLVFNERLSEDPEFEEVVEAVREFVKAQEQGSYFEALWKIVKHVPGDLTGMKRTLQLRSKIFDFVKKHYAKHKETFDATNLRDYIDVFLSEAAAKNGSDYFTETQLQNAIFHLFLAGMETTSTTLLWATVLLAKYPDVQHKMHLEILQTLGHSKLPDMTHKAKMRYTDAVLHEIQRYATLVPLGVPHRATEAGTVCGYHIPKDCIVISNILNVHRSSKLWKQPHAFDPNNFLHEDEDGTNCSLINTNYMIGFSTGKRVCLGESLARQELFIFLVGLVQRFEFVEDASEPLPSVDECEDSLIVRAPRKFRVIAKIRQTSE